MQIIFNKEKTYEVRRVSEIFSPEKLSEVILSCIINYSEEVFKSLGQYIFSHKIDIIEIKKDNKIIYQTVEFTNCKVLTRDISGDNDIITLEFMKDDNNELS